MSEQPVGEIKVAKKTPKVRKPRPKLTPEILVSDVGIKRILRDFNKIPFKGKNNEV